MTPPKAGDRINNYLLEAQVGAGSFGQVWRARHHVLNEVVAIKILTDPQYVRTFRQEGVVVHGLRHPNIVRAIDIDPYAERPYMVMEYVDGPSLREVIENHPAGVPLESSLRILRGMLAGLQAAHDAGLVHRDVKPANILLRLPHRDVSRVEEGDVKLTDFGLGKTSSMTTASLVQSGSLVTDEGRNIAGTLVYMSPEQRSGGELDARSDLYASGVVLFELLTGSRPAGAESPSQVRADLPVWLDDVFRGAYARLERRFATAAAMRATLEGGMRTAKSKVSAGYGIPAARRVGQATSVEAHPARPAGGAYSGCPSCKQVVQQDDNFCIHCGRQLVADVPRCGACQAFVSRYDRFCIFCGQKLNGGAANFWEG
jgi:serine/threonine protein kinase/RNA polymerase subunit RPABC4/transcription elongation factor Spt4